VYEDFFGYCQYGSVTLLLHELGLPSFNTHSNPLFILNKRLLTYLLTYLYMILDVSFQSSLLRRDNRLVGVLTR